MNIVIIFSIAVVIAIIFCSLLVKKNKKLKTDIEGFKIEIANLRKEKDAVQMKNYELSQLVEEFQTAQKKAVEVKKKAESAKKTNRGKE
jgi:regulator of replication initiation timing